MQRPWISSPDRKLMNFAIGWKETQIVIVEIVRWIEFAVSTNLLDLINNPSMINNQVLIKRTNLRV